MKESWKKNLDLEIMKNSIRALKSKKYFPSEKKALFKPFNFFELEDTKLVILGSSPYRYNNLKRPCATGLALGLEQGDTPSHSIIRESLFKALGYIDIEYRLDWSLESWAKQGVLLLNSSLTIPLLGNVNTHLVIWKSFIENVIDIISNKTNSAFVFLGSEARAFNKNLGKNYPHPTTTATKLFNKSIPFDYDFRVNNFFNDFKNIKWIDES